MKTLILIVLYCKSFYYYYLLVNPLDYCSFFELDVVTVLDAILNVID